MVFPVKETDESEQNEEGVYKLGWYLMKAS